MEEALHHLTTSVVFRFLAWMCPAAQRCWAPQWALGPSVPPFPPLPPMLDSTSADWSVLSSASGTVFLYLLVY